MLPVQGWLRQLPRPTRELRRQIEECGAALMQTAISQ